MIYGCAGEWKIVHELQKASVWIFLLAIMAIAAVNSTKLIGTVWRVWQAESGQSASGSPDAGSAKLSMISVQR
jgi:hypothetical protein